MTLTSADIALLINCNPVFGMREHLLRVLNATRHQVVLDSANCLYLSLYTAIQLPARTRQQMLTLQIASSAADSSDGAEIELLQWKESFERYILLRTTSFNLL